MINITQEQISTFKDAMKIWGDKTNILQCVEELSELQKSLLKSANHDKSNLPRISEDIADVLVTLKLVEMIYDNAQDTQKFFDAKMERLARLNAEKSTGL